MLKTVPMATALLLAACGAPSPQGAKLTVTVVGDPARVGGLADRLAAETAAATLIARDGAGETVPGLASSWRFVDDGQSLILRLRPMQWSDGKPLTSNDVMSAFRRGAAPPKRDPGFVQAGLSNARAVATGRTPASKLGVRAPISRVVELRLEAASPLLLGWLTQPGLAVTRPEKGVTLAAYRTDGTSERRILTRTSAVSTPEARPATIVLETTDDAAAAVAAFARRERDIVIGDGLAGLAAARVGARAEALRIDPLWGIYGYLANGLRGPVSNPAVRRALALAVDRAALAERFGITAMAPVEGLLPPSLAGDSGVVPGAVPDGSERFDTPLATRLSQARALLARAGWSAEKPLRLVLLLPPGSDHRAVAERVAADWARIGVLLAVTEIAPGVIDRLTARGDFDLAVSEASVPVADAGALLARYRCGAGPNCNPAADAMLEAARLAPPAQRPALLARAAATLMEAPPLVPLFTPVRWALVSPEVEGWVPNVAASHPLARLAVTGRRR